MNYEAWANDRRIFKLDCYEDYLIADLSQAIRS
jgi:hypothetical protein